MRLRVRQHPGRVDDVAPTVRLLCEPECLLTVNRAMKSYRTAWNIVRRLHPKDVPAANRFAEMGLVSRTKPVEATTYGDLLAAVAQADAMGVPSLGTALMLTWEWLQREEHIFTAFKLEYRPKKHPNEV